MKVWLELDPQEGERLFEAVKEFKVDRRSEEKQIPIEKVRAVLAEKSQSGKQSQVKDLITKYGAQKLPDVDPASYPQLLKEAEEL